ncbi:MAG: c-type cytochrome [Myxococcota bacterium]
MRLLWVVTLLAGCGGSLRDDRFPTGSGTMVATRGYDAYVAVNVDEGTVSRLDRATGAVSELAVGREPTRIARVGKRELWVTLRGERAIAVVEDDHGALKTTGKIPAGAEPHGIVASEDGDRVYVANTLSDEVAEYDGKSRELLRTFHVQDEPKWLALHPNGEVLYVASAKNGTLSYIDLDDGEVSPVSRPHHTRNGSVDGEIDLDPRNTGDLTISADGTILGVPGIYADTETSVDDPTSDEPVQSGYGSSGIDVSRLNPVLVEHDLGSDGRPVEGDPGRSLFLAAAVFTERAGFVFRSFPSSATVSPSGDEWLVTMEGSNVVLVVPTDDPSPSDSSTDAVFSDSSTGGGPAPGGLPFTSPQDAGFVVRPITVVTTSAGPRGIAFASDDEARVHTFLDRTIEQLPFDEVDDADAMDDGEMLMFTSELQTRIADAALPADIEAGRRLFYSAVDERMAANGAGVSCSTCHADGRNDGVTWTIAGELRQTPSLAGPVNDTAPVTWEGTVASVAEEASLTSFLRMGGTGLTETEAAQIDAFVNAQRYPDVRRAGEQSALVALGAEVFARADVGCASCHGGALFTDNQAHPIVGPIATQTPTLRGISATAPYFHDGTAPDLRAVLTMARGGAMGDTSSLSDGELDALVAYLESL